MILQNTERLADYDIRPDWAEGRRPGLAACVRLKDEADWAVPSLNSIAPWCDEIVIALQGEQSDGTDVLVEDWANGRPQARVVRYPFDSLPNGPGHGDQPVGSVFERAYFYNWTLAQTRCSHALVWDGDMVALDSLGPLLSAAVGRRGIGLRLDGVEIAKWQHQHGQAWVSGHRPTITQITPRLFEVSPATYYVSGDRCEQLNRDGLACERAAGPQFLHFKWAKPHRSIAKSWPKGWEEMPHFQRLLMRAAPGAAYEGPLPRVLAVAD